MFIEEYYSTFVLIASNTLAIPSLDRILFSSIEVSLASLSLLYVCCYINNNTKVLIAAVTGVAKEVLL
jgi:hypothetical protein